MDKKDVQKRVLQHGVPLELAKFSWNEKTKTFSSSEHNLVLDFANVNGCTFDTGYGCTFVTGYNCTFDTGYNCTFGTGYNCTFDTGSHCTFVTGSHCVIVRRDTFEVIRPLEGETLQLCPYGIEGFLSNGILNRDESLGKHVIADNILSKVVSAKGGVFKVVNHGQYGESYLIKKNGLYAHGETLREAKESLKYKIANRDTSEYEDYTLDTTMTQEEAITMYMVITGACSYGTRAFVGRQDLTSEEFTVQDIIDLTKGQFGNGILTEFFS